MRRIGKGNKIVKNCIVWAMSAMIAVGSIAPAQVVRAEGTETQQVEAQGNITTYSESDKYTNYGAPSADDTATDSDGNTAAKYKDDEAAKNAQGADVQNLAQKTQIVEDAKTDAEAAVSAADAAVSAAQKAETEATAANGPIVAEEKAAEAAATAANSAEGVVTAGEKTKSDVETYNAAAKKINEGSVEVTTTDPVTQKTMKEQKLVKKEADGTLTVDDTIADNAQSAIDASNKAEASALDAKEKLEAALDVSITDEQLKNTTSDEYIDLAAKVQDVKDAAAEAAKNATEAGTYVDAAEQELVARITEYNKNAYILGEPAYVYHHQNSAGKWVDETPGYSGTIQLDKNTLGKELADLKSAQLDDSAIVAAENTVQAAATAKTKADNAADVAANAVTVMNKKINGDPDANTQAGKDGDKKLADDNCEQVNTTYKDVNPEKQALDDSIKDCADKQAAFDDTKKSVLQKGINKYNNKINDYDDTINNIWLLKIIRNKAQDDKNEFLKNNPTAEGYAQAYADSDDEYNKKKQELADAQAQVQTNRDKSDEADAVIQSAVDAYNANTVDKLIDLINKNLSSNGLQVNQAQYDKDANKWANSTTKLDGTSYNTEGDLIEDAKQLSNCLDAKKDLRKYFDESSVYGMDDSKFSGLLKEILNRPAITQWLIGTGSTDEKIDAVIAAAESQLTLYNEQLQVVKANAAKCAVDQAASKAAAITTAQNKNYGNVKDLTNMNSVDSRVNAANQKITDARDKFTEEQRKLTALQDEVKDYSLINPVCWKLKAAIIAAQHKVTAAKKELSEANKAAELAQSDAEYAESLIDTTQQTAMMFGRKDASGNVIADNSDNATTGFIAFDNKGDQSVITRDSSNFTGNMATTTLQLPYNIYNAYVKKMTGYGLNHTKTDKSGNVVNDYSTWGTNYSNRQNGTGIAIATDDKETHPATMPVVYWELTEDGKGLTGKYYLSEADLPIGTYNYFVGYVLKGQSDGNHMDGMIVSKTHTNITPTPTPEPTTIVTTISNAPTALAAAPAVLGARRTPEATPVADTDKAVLGAKRGVATGDDSNAAGWIALMICTMGAGAAVVLGRRKEQENVQ